MWKWACLTPHPPIIVEGVGGGREQEAEKTMEAMERLAEKHRVQRPDCILILSPHAPWGKGVIISNGSLFRGSLETFGHPEIDMELNGCPEGAEAAALCLENAVPVTVGAWGELDHGAFVPLHFFKKSWGSLPPIVLANPLGLNIEESIRAGEALRSMEDGKSWALIASGDLSHRLIPGAPAGYSPDGRILDRQIIRSLREGSPDSILEMSPGTISRGGECGLKSVSLLLGLVRGPMEILSYQGPFGVGYCVADGKVRDKEQRLHPSVCIARRTIENVVGGFSPSEDRWLGDQEFSRPGACFVTLKKRGQLRGCIGTLAPTRDSLLKEISANAVASSTSDPRFPPVRPDELDELQISVDILSVPEEIMSMDQLDPAKYGVIVTKGPRRGVLLPDLEGITTPEKQVSIAASKAGIGDLEGISLQRFTVERHEEVHGL